MKWQLNSERNEKTVKIRYDKSFYCQSFQLNHLSWYTVLYLKYTKNVLLFFLQYIFILILIKMVWID